MADQINPADRFIWQPGDIVIISRGGEPVDTSGIKAELPPMPPEQRLALEKEMREWLNNQ